MPAVEARVREIIFFGDRVLVEFLVVRVHQLDVGQAFVLRYEAVANNLHFGLVWYGFKIGVQDAAFSIEGLAVAVAHGRGVEAVGYFVLGLGRARSVLEDDYVGFIECIPDDGEVVVCDVSVSTVGADITDRDTYLGGYRSTECSLITHIPCYYIDSVVIYLPVKFSRSTFSMTAPKSTSDEGTDIGVMEIG